MPIYDAAMLYQARACRWWCIAGKEYGSGSSRDWAAKGTMLLGVKAVIAESYERIHRSNLVNMGVLPLEFMAGESAAIARAHRPRVFEFVGAGAALTPRGRVSVRAPPRRRHRSRRSRQRAHRHAGGADGVFATAASCRTCCGSSCANVVACRCQAAEAAGSAVGRASELPAADTTCSPATAIKAHARALGFDLCGIAPATALPELARLRDWLDRG